MSSAAAHHVTFAPELDPATPDTTDSEESDVDILDVLNESLDVVAMEKLQAGLAFSQQQANAHPGTRPASPTSTDVGDDSDDDSEDAMALAATAPSSGSFAAGVQMVAAPRLSYAPGTKTQGSGLAPSAVAAPVALRIACGWAENGPVVQNHIQELAVTAECGGARIGLGRAFPGWGRPGAYALVLIPEMCVGEDAFVPVPGRELLGDKFCPELIAPALDTGDIAYDEDGAMRVSARLWLKAKDLAAYKPHKELLRCRLVVTRCATPRAPAAVVAEGTTPAYRAPPAARPTPAPR
eukprot:tig00020510_g9878.t1